MRWVKLFADEREAEMVVAKGGMRTLRVAGHKVCLVYGESGWYAIENDCPHLGESLARGVINNQEEVICPWHSYRFHLRTGREAMQRCRDAHVYPLQIGKEGMFIGLEG